MVLWPPESHLSLNANLVHAKHSFVALLIQKTRTLGWGLGFGRRWQYHAELWRHQNCQLLLLSIQHNVCTLLQNGSAMPKKSPGVDKIIPWDVGSTTRLKPCIKASGCAKCGPISHQSMWPSMQKSTQDAGVFVSVQRCKTLTSTLVYQVARIISIWWAVSN
jgi:hypothetical protein